MASLEQSILELQQTNAALVNASGALTSEVTDVIEVIDQHVETAISQIETQQAAANAKFDEWLNTRHVGFGLVDTLMDHSQPYITLPPRFATLEEAEAFQFSSAFDYAPTTQIDADNSVSHYVDLNAKLPGGTNYYSEPYPTQFTKKVSVYASISVGDNPHPAVKPVARLAVLMNRHGAVSSWINSSDSDFSKPRTLLYDESKANMEIKGHSWGVTNYDDLIALAENEPNSMGHGFSAIRIINLGPEPIYIKGLWIIHHGHNKEA